eukprot:GHVQ01013700.1.p1 GENE.GHVQ01013700.1~~GHVQ01013700.1.p1  ORF type:complete len:335 (+),score=47.36 GHVQ01013700.1:165-1169(+)
MEDNEMDYEYESDGYELSDEHEGMESDVVIENMFYEAEDNKKINPELSIQQFRSVMEMEQKAKVDGTIHYRFQSLRNIIEISSHLDTNVEIKDYELLLSWLNRVRPNEAIEAIQSAQVSFASRHDSRQMYKLTITYLKNLNMQHLWFRTCKKLAILEMAAGEFDSVRQLIQELYDSRKEMVHGDVNTAAADFLQLYALELEFCVVTNDQRRIHEILRQAAPVRSAIGDPSDLAMIGQEQAKVFMSNGCWKKAYSEFFDSFRNYQEAGSLRSIDMLKYAVLCNMMSMSEINPLDCQEARQYQHDHQLADIADMWDAFQSHNVVNMYENQSIARHC